MKDVNIEHPRTIMSYGPMMGWFLAAFFYLFEMVLRASNSVMADDLLRDFSINAQQLSIMTSAYYWAYVPMQLPCGLILDKIGPRLLLTLSCILCVLGAFLMGTTNILSLGIFARFLMGAGSACAFISCLSLVIGHFSRKRFALMAGLTNMMGCIGGCVANRPLAWLLNITGNWRLTMVIMGILGLILAGIILMFVPGPLVSFSQKKTNEPPLLKSLFSLIKNPTMILIGLVGGLMYLPVSIFSELWAGPFLQATYHISRETAAWWNTIFYVSMGFGGPIIAWMVPLHKSYIKVMIITGVILTSLFCVLSFTSSLGSYIPFLSSFNGSIVLAILIGIAMGGQVLAFSLATDYAPKHLGGTASALTNALVMGLEMIFQPLFGMILDFYAKSESSSLSEAKNAVPIYTDIMYRNATLILCGALLLSVFLLFFIKDTYKKTIEKA